MASASHGVLSYDPAILERCGSLQVHAVYSHAWHLRTDDAFILTMIDSRHDGPLTVRVAGLAREHGVSPGNTGTLTAAGIEIGPLAFSFVGAVPWIRHAGPDRSIDGRVLRTDITSIGERIHRASRGGLVLSERAKRLSANSCGSRSVESPTRGGATERRGHEEIAGMMAALANVDGAGVRRHALGLMGLGPGLTPSGDDVLCGLAAGLSVLERRSGRHAASCGEALAVLTACVESEARHRTTLLSSTLLRCAVRGIATAPLLEVLATMGSGERMRGVEDVLMIGHSSGSDMLTGALMACITLLRWEEVSVPAVDRSR